MLKKNYSRRIDALKMFRRHMEMLSQAQEATSISYLCFQNILQSYRRLSEYKEKTRVHEYTQRINALTLLPELNAFAPPHENRNTFCSQIENLSWSLPDATQTKFSNEIIPDLAYTFICGENAEQLKTILDGADEVIRYYKELYQATKNE